MPRNRRRRRLSAASLNSSFNTEPAHSSDEDGDATFVDLGENDDTAERSKARKHPSRKKSLVPMITPVRKSRNASHRSRRSNRAGSPSPFHSASGLRRRAYTNDELSQIYKDCIIKAQQNKINQANAWTLHLVDQIQEITDLNSHNPSANGNLNASMQASAQSDMTTAFARASHTIDAASKIYGYRVDSVHNKTYKVLGSIHQSKAGDGGDSGEGDEAAQRKRKRQQRNRNVGRATLLEGDKVSKINESIKHLCVEVDALFHKTASCFDEGGAKGLLMNTLYVQNGCEVVFDSSTKIEQNEDVCGVGVEVEEVVDEAEVRKEQEWMTQLVEETWKVEVRGGDFGVCTQNEPDNFELDMEWIESSKICPLLEVFENHINQTKERVVVSLDTDEEKINDSGGNDAMDMGDPDAGNPLPYENDDDDVLMDMDFTLGGNEALNAQDLFHDEPLTQAAAIPFPAHAQHNQQQLVQPIAFEVNNNSALNLSMNPNSAHPPSYIAGQQASSMGNMGVQAALQSSLGDSELLLSTLQQEQASHTTLHQSGISKTGAINLNAMNEVISKLENADFESLTSFFDSKKHGNWAGPDQWYHRRYMMIANQHSKQAKPSAASRNHSPSSRSQTVSHANGMNGGSVHAAGTKKRAKRKAFDFMEIAKGELVDEAEFDEPQRSDNTLTQAVLDKNRKTHHTLPKDLQIKPDMFIKLFHRENYSVWKHWLRQHQLRMLKKKQEELQSGGVDGMMNGEIERGLGDVGMEEAAGGMDDVPEFMAQQAAAMAVVDVCQQDDEEEFKYNYENALDTSHFVPDLVGQDGMRDDGFNFQLNGYDLVDIDPGKKLEEIKVEYSLSSKKVNIRKLKFKLWDKIDSTLPERSQESEKENDSDKSNRNVAEVERMDVDDDGKEDTEIAQVVDLTNQVEGLSFQSALDSLPNNISSAISVHMCFICLLHLANEKELQLVPADAGVKKVETENVERAQTDVDGLQKGKHDGNFVIEYASASSLFEKEARKINPMMVLGMQ